MVWRISPTLLSSLRVRLDTIDLLAIGLQPPAGLKINDADRVRTYVIDIRVETILSQVGGNRSVSSE
jgi:hypothetical protein